jgi:hypothetical protein
MSALIMNSLPGMPTTEIFEQAAQELKELARRYHHFQEDPTAFLEAIRNKGEVELRRYLEESEPYVTRKIDGVDQVSPVNFLRRVVVTRMVGGMPVTLGDLREIEQKIEAKDLDYFSEFTGYLDAIAAQKERKRSAFSSWDAFRELFYIDYANRAQHVKELLEQMALFLKNELDLPEVDWHAAGFDHNQNFGTDLCWLALYPKRAGDHKKAIQIFVSVGHDRFRYGLIAGSHIPNRKEYEDCAVRDDLNVPHMIDAFRRRLSRYFDVNRQVQARPVTPQGDEVEAQFPLNVVLYGPPGTGKTYSVKQRAVQIIEGVTAELEPVYTRERFSKYLNERRIEFITFHPSYSYEEFIEGFRFEPEAGVPVLKDGLLKQIAQRALDPQDGRGGQEESQIWKVSLGGASDPDLFGRCIQNNEIAIGWFDDVDLAEKSEEEIRQLFEREGRGQEKNNIRSVNYFVNEIKKGDYVAILKDQKTIRAIGVVDDVYEYREQYDKYRHTRPVVWLDKRDHDIYEMNGNRNIGMPTIYKLDHVSFQEFVGLLLPRREEPRPYVLIIDEINRGNLSRIFGELITLLEPDKRLGAPNELTIRLPYSQRPFSLPRNLFVIGTMNSADRSIALIDVALRRRFRFEEMMPQEEIIRKTLAGFLDAEDEEIELTPALVDLICGVFTRLNQRVTVLLDRDHQIGHSFFMHVKSLAQLHDVLYRQVFPTLLEYFYNDRYRLARLLGEFQPASGSGFVKSLSKSYLRAFGEQELTVEEEPWQLHTFAVGELEEALRRTFDIGGGHGG